jgi:hypothetical protein
VAFGKQEFELKDFVQEQTQRLAEETPNEESCGFILRDDNVIRCKNVFYNPMLDDKDEQALAELMDELIIRDVSLEQPLDKVREAISVRTGIAISARDRLAADSKGIAAVWHSHCLDSSPGMLTYEDNPALGIHSDITQSKLQRLPYVMYHTRFKEWDMYDPYNLSPYPLKKQIAHPENPDDYANLPYCWNRADCLEIPRSALWGMFGIDLGIHLRSHPSEYMTEGWQRYVDDLPKLGFEEVPMFDAMKFKAGDCLLAQLPRHKTLHHLFLLVDEPKQLVLHVMDGGLSVIEPVAKWRRFVRVLFRHQKFI